MSSNVIGPRSVILNSMKIVLAYGPGRSKAHVVCATSTWSGFVAPDGLQWAQSARSLKTAQHIWSPRIVSEPSGITVTAGAPRGTAYWLYSASALSRSVGLAYTR